MVTQNVFFFTLEYVYQKRMSKYCLRIKLAQLQTVWSSGRREQINVLCEHTNYGKGHRTQHVYISNFLPKVIICCTVVSLHFFEPTKARKMDSTAL